MSHQCWSGETPWSKEGGSGGANPTVETRGSSTAPGVAHCGSPLTGEDGAGETSVYGL